MLVVSSCSKNESPVIPDDRYSFDNTTTVEAGTNNDLSVTKFNADYDLSAKNLVIKDPSKFLTSSISYAGKTATITTKSVGIKEFTVTYTYGSGQVTDIVVPFKYVKK